jgi:hypothetical protein
MAVCRTMAFLDTWPVVASTVLQYFRNDVERFYFPISELLVELFDS